MDKTILEDFKTKYPNAPLYSDGTPKMCTLVLGYEKYKYCNTTKDNVTCVECWNRTMNEMNNK